MKIQKFNEKINTTDWNDSKIKKYAKLNGELEDMKDSFGLLLLEYLTLNPNLQEGDGDDLINDETYVESFNIYPNHPYIIIEIGYFPSPEHDIYGAQISKKQYTDFLEFLEAPDLYQNAKKYNL